MRDDLGHPMTSSHRPRRVVSLVPSLTEAIAASASDVLVGATEWCTHPAGLDVPRFGGTKNPDVDGILAAAPDLVVANEEENKPEHVADLRAAGMDVWVTDIRTVEQALASLARLLDVLDAPERGWLDDAAAAWSAIPEVPRAERRTALVPIWRRPWMALGRDTYAGDVLARLGVDNVLADADERYPRVDLTRIVGDVDLVVLPDEPYRFTADDGPEAFAPLPCALVSGRHLTWYGPAMVDAPRLLADAINAADGAADGDAADPSSTAPPAG
ncbi:helical backbone metal receptor [Mobilicoccus pelagius]|uniref:Fe/B12 periplasmic-binding domain-containing protein n=1 Tax=Mobilicoccus pelagius NBRC 104925 TaxID=1089455 RepID=H5UQA5_9MICO|nr:helical backbone metal receptor [Mobilicoccus pelagius]GAB47913.1 hypothetical protein MOPEL_031_00160 [Mobilicoccus pelagius NBRC 104925]